MVGDVDWAYNEFTGEMLAIHEFNAAHEDMKIAPVQGLRFFGGKLPSLWHEQIVVAHLFATLTMAARFLTYSNCLWKPSD